MYSFWVGPENFDVLIAQGPDAARFLQGQLTCDVMSLIDDGHLYGTACNNKGRIIGAFSLIKSNSSYYLCCAAGVGVNLLDALKKYIPFYKCSLQLAPIQNGLFALAGEAISVAEKKLGMNGLSAGSTCSQPEGWFTVFPEPPLRAFWYCPTSTPNLQSDFQEKLESWEALSLLSGHYPFKLQDVEKYTPQELQYERSNYVSFTKGCYTGQEIVARMHYRGKQKKQLYLITWPQDHEVLESEVILKNSAGETYGHSLLTRRLNKQAFALAQLPVELAESNMILFDGQGTSVSWQTFETASP